MKWFAKLFKKKRWKYLNLSLKAIVRWEQMNGKPFSLLRYNASDEVSENEILSLFYVSTITDNEYISFDEFKKNTSSKEVKQMISAFEKQIAFISQFQSNDNSDNNQEKQNSSDNSSSLIFTKDLIAMLVIHGLDLTYVMEHMDFCDLTLFIQTYNQKEKDRLTEQRLWTFMQLLPHLEKGATPEKFYPFPWDHQDDEVSASQESTETNIESLKIFLQSGLKI